MTEQEKKEAHEVARLIIKEYGDVLKRLAET